VLEYRVEPCTSPIHTTPINVSGVTLIGTDGLIQCVYIYTERERERETGRRVYGGTKGLTFSRPPLLEKVKKCQGYHSLPGYERFMYYSANCYIVASLRSQVSIDLTR
jgi:hypothetical protein